VEITRNSIKRLANSRLYVLIDGRATLDDFRQLAQTLIAAGVHVLQLRIRNSTTGNWSNVPGFCKNYSAARKRCLLLMIGPTWPPFAARTAFTWAKKIFR